MLFAGHSEHSIDAKQRLAIPAKYRNQWNPERDGGAWFCVPWPEGHLRLYTESTFRKLASQDPASLTPDDTTASYETDLFGFAERIEMDSAGRITLPKLHLELTHLPSEVVIVGARSRLEVRNRSEWRGSVEDRFENLRSLSSRLKPRTNDDQPD